MFLRKGDHDEYTSNYLRRTAALHCIAGTSRKYRGHGLPLHRKRRGVFPWELGGRGIGGMYADLNGYAGFARQNRHLGYQRGCSNDSD